MSEDLESVGEFGLIERLLARLPLSALPVGPGDDAAVVAERDGISVLATADLLIEGRHFDLAFSSLSDIGFKAIACNASDIAAMGGRPTAALVSLGCPSSSSVTGMESLYDGVAAASRVFGVTVAGGDVVGSERLIVSVAMLGETARPVLRSGARPGDALCVTGTLGAAAAGLWLSRGASDDEDARGLLQRFPGLGDAHRRGRARVPEGVAAARAGARAMIDISDGFGQDVGHLCEASGCAAMIDAAALPLADGVDEVATWIGRSAVDIGLSGGDDYELALAIDPGDVGALRDAIDPTSLTIVGRFTEGEGVTLDDGTPLRRAGWDHFA